MKPIEFEFPLRIGVLECAGGYAQYYLEDAGGYIIAYAHPPQLVSGDVLRNDIDMLETVKEKLEQLHQIEEAFKDSDWDTIFDILYNSLELSDKDVNKSLRKFGQDPDKLETEGLAIIKKIKEKLNKKLNAQKGGSDE